MRWLYMGKREYPSFIIDKERFKLRKLNEKEAYEFLKWYVDHMDERIAILKDLDILFYPYTTTSF